MAVQCSECGARVARPMVAGGKPLLCAKCEMKARDAAPSSQRDDENMSTLDAPAPPAPIPSRPPSGRGSASQPPRNYSVPPGPRIPMGSTPPPRPAPRPSTFPLAPDGTPRPSNRPPPPSNASSSNASTSGSSANKSHASPSIRPTPSTPPAPSRPGPPRPGGASTSRRPPVPGPPRDHEQSSEFDPVKTGDFDVVGSGGDEESLGTGDIEIDPPPRPPRRR